MRGRLRRPAPRRAQPSPRSLARIIRRALERDPERRQASAAEFRDDLDRSLKRRRARAARRGARGLPVRPGCLQEGASRPARRRSPGRGARRCSRPATAPAPSMPSTASSPSSPDQPVVLRPPRSRRAPRPVARAARRSPSSAAAPRRRARGGHQAAPATRAGTRRPPFPAPSGRSRLPAPTEPVPAASGASAAGGSRSPAAAPAAAPPAGAPGRGRGSGGRTAAAPPVGRPSRSPCTCARTPSARCSTGSRWPAASSGWSSARPRQARPPDRARLLRDRTSSRSTAPTAASSARSRCRSRPARRCCGSRATPTPRSIVDGKLLGTAGDSPREPFRVPVPPGPRAPTRARRELRIEAPGQASARGLRSGSAPARRSPSPRIRAGGRPVIALLLAALLATPATDLKRAKDRYEFGAYADAAGAVRQVFAQYPDTPEPQAVEAWRILGLAEYQLGDQAASRDAFVHLLSVNPDYSLDPFLVPPNIVDFFDRVKREAEPQLQPLRERKKQLAGAGAPRRGGPAQAPRRGGRPFRATGEAGHRPGAGLRHQLPPLRRRTVPERRHVEGDHRRGGAGGLRGREHRRHPPPQLHRPGRFPLLLFLQRPGLQQSAHLQLRSRSSCRTSTS